MYAFLLPVRNSILCVNEMAVNFHLVSQTVVVICYDMHAKQYFNVTWATYLHLTNVILLTLVIVLVYLI